MPVLFQNEVRDVKLLLLDSIKMKFKYLPSDKLIDELKHYFYFAEWDEMSEYANCFDGFQNFLFKDNLNTNTNIKIKLGSFDFLIDYNNEEKRFSCEAFLFIYSNVDIVNIFFNIPIDSISADELVYIRKVIQFDKTPVTIHNNGFLKRYLEFTSITFDDIASDIVKILIKLSGYQKYKFKYLLSEVKKLKFKINYDDFYDASYKEMNKQKMMVVEIRDIPGMDASSFSAEDFNDNYGKMLYGILVCDEGYAYVPRSCVLKALEDNFASRDHFRIYASNIGVLLVNLVNSVQQKEYEDFQRKLADVFKDKSSNLLCSHPIYAGLEHGALLSMERVNILFVIINSNMKKEYFTSKNSFRSVRKIINNRQKMIEIINMVMSFNINEITALSDIIMRKVGIFNYVDRVRERLDIAEDDTLIIYQKWNNIITLSIAILGIIFAAMSISEIKTFIYHFLTRIFH